MNRSVYDEDSKAFRQVTIKNYNNNGTLLSMRQMRYLNDARGIVRLEELVLHLPGSNNSKSIGTNNQTAVWRIRKRCDSIDYLALMKTQ